MKLISMQSKYFFLADVTNSSEQKGNGNMFSPAMKLKACTMLLSLSKVAVAP